MPSQVTSFDDCGTRIVGRDDGTVAQEFMDEFGDSDPVLKGTVCYSPDTAIEIGKLLIIKGTQIKEALAVGEALK